MALPQMDSDPTAVDRVASVRPATTIAVAHAQQQARAEAATVVLKGDRPVGIVTAAALAGALAKHRPETPIATVMGYVAVPVDPQGDAYEAVRAFRRTAWDWLKHRQA